METLQKWPGPDKRRPDLARFVPGWIFTGDEPAAYPYVSIGLCCDLPSRALRDGANHESSPGFPLPGSVMTMMNRTHKGITILYPEGKIVLGDGDQELGEAVRHSLEQGSRKLIINFSGVSYLDSSGVGELVGCYTSIRHQGGDLRICCLNARISNLLKMTSLTSVFAVMDTEADAVAGF